MVVVDALEIGAVCYSCSTAAIMNGVHMFICSPVINSRATVGCCPIVVDLLSESMSTNENSPSLVHVYKIAAGCHHVACHATTSGAYWYHTSINYREITMVSRPISSIISY